MRQHRPLPQQARVATLLLLLRRLLHPHRPCLVGLVRLLLGFLMHVVAAVVVSLRPPSLHTQESRPREVIPPASGLPSPLPKQRVQVVVVGVVVVVVVVVRWLALVRL